MDYKRFFVKLYRISKAVIIIVPFFLLFWLINKDLVKNGQLEYVYNFDQTKPYITNLYPEDRLTARAQIGSGQGYEQSLVKEPVYFDVRLPQSFKTATVQVTYQNSSLPLVSLGLMTYGAVDWSYVFKPLENQLIDRLPWVKIENQQGTLWEKQKNYLSINQFFDEKTSQTKYAAYDYPLTKKFILTDYQIAKQKTELDFTLRGAHSFYTYIKNEPLDFSFTIQDLNLSEGADNFTVKVYNSSDQQIYEKTLEDNNTLSRFSQLGALNVVNIRLPLLSEGVYKVVLDCGDDIIIRKISTWQKYLAFIDHLYLADNPEYLPKVKDLKTKPAVVYSTLPRIGLETFDQAGLQEVSLDSAAVNLSEVGKIYYQTPDKLPSLILVSKSGLEISGQGLLSLTKETYFNPEIYRLRDLTDLSNIDYLISQYQTPKEVSGWKVGQVQFDLSQARIINGKIRFAFSVPELNDGQGTITINQIKVNLYREPQTWKDLAFKAIKYLINKF